LIGASEKLKARTMSAAAYWRKYCERITAAFESATPDNFADSIRALFKSCLTWTWAAFARACYIAGGGGRGRVQVSVALLAVVNSKLPFVGQRTVAYFLFRFRDSLARAGHPGVARSAALVCECYRQAIVGAPIVVQIITQLLPNPTFLKLLIDLLWDVAPVLFVDDKTALSLIFQELYKQSDNAQFAPEIQKLALWRQRNWSKDVNGKKICYKRLPKKFDLVEEGDQICHDGLDLDEINEDPTDGFADAYDLDGFDTIRIKYKEFLSGLFGDDEEEEAVPAAAFPPIDVSEISATESAVQHEVLRNEELQIKRRVYLTIVSNVTSNATAHVLLKMAAELGEQYERIILTMCVDYTGMEKTYNRDLGVLVELLCRAKPNFVEMVESSFVKNYGECFKFTVHRITNLASLYAYLLSRDVIGWHAMCVITLTEADTTSAQRVFIRVLVEELAHNLSFDGLVRKFQEPGVAEHVADLFPVDSLENAQFASAYFHEIQLHCLCERLDREIERMLEEAEAQKQKELRLIQKLQGKKRHEHHHHRSRDRLPDD
jgi:pre-mRNA-splicing factor CWC22